jgi:PKD repeat protein
MWSGGPYDGHGSAYESACIVPPNFFVGGPFDGHGTAAQFGTCVQNIYAGGPYDGHAAVAQYATCELSIYAGGPYDGHGVVAQYATCVLSIFAGGPYDGHSSATLLAACSNNIFTGGPYDGHGAASRFGNCFQNIFVGGPYDGHGAQFLPCNLPNIFAGGPYDGFGVAIRLAVGAIGDTVCPGNPATLTANSPVDWYDVPTGGTPLAVGATTFVTPPLANTRIYYISGGCGGTPKTGSIHGRTQVIAHVLGYISPAATSVPACAGFPTQFYNQTTVSGAPVASLNPTGHITSLGTTGTPPSPGQLTFSSASGGTPNYTRLRDGVHDGSGAWTGGNTAVSDVTHWIQLNYVSPRSINRFYYWNDPNINYRFHAPRQIRLYYQGATGWVLVKVFNPPYPSNSTYDTGPIGETNGLFANRWKMEVDVDTTYAPRWGEFQVFASGPTIGGTLNWDFGDGNTSTAQNPAHVYTTPGTYTVTLSASAPECCSNPISFPVEVCEVLPLAVEQNHLVGWFRPESQDIQLQWDVVGTFATAAFQKWVGNQWVTLDSQAYTPANRYYALDAAPTYNANNLYRVRYYDADGNHGLSNSVNIRPGLPTAEYARIYPNPVDGTEFNLDLSLLQPTEVYLRIVDMAGREVKRIYLGNQPAGDTRHLVPAQGLSAGVYAVEVQAGSLTHRERILFLRP